MQDLTSQQRLPRWFRTRLSTNERYAKVRGQVLAGGLHTVCESAACPNRNECWNSGTATFLILGDVCTRQCGFCNIGSGEPRTVEQEEPVRIADAVARLGLSYAVVTSVTRDDLPDGGAGQFAATIREIVLRSPACRVEVLVPDFHGLASSLDTVLEARPSILNHNIETVPSLYSRVRPQAEYSRSLRLLERAAVKGITTKSGLMLGLGEGMDEVRSVLRDLRGAGCSFLTIGQYLRSNKRSLPVVTYYRPEDFEELRREALGMGFQGVFSGPLVRSSYRAEQSCVTAIPSGPPS